MASRSPRRPSDITVRIPGPHDHRHHHAISTTRRREQLVRKLLEIFYDQGKGRSVLRRNQKKNKIVRSLQVKSNNVNMGSERNSPEIQTIRLETPSGDEYEDSTSVEEIIINDGRTPRGTGPTIIVRERSASEVAESDEERISPPRSGREAGAARGRADHGFRSAMGGRDEGERMQYERGRFVQRRGRSSERHRASGPITNYVGGGPGDIWFFTRIDGHVCTDYRPAHYHKKRRNEDLKRLLVEQYRSLRQRYFQERWACKPFREIAFVYFHLWICKDPSLDIWELVDSAGIEETSRSNLSGKSITNHFRHQMKHPPEGVRWTNLLDDKLKIGSKSGNDYLVMVEIVEGLSTRWIYIGTFLWVTASTILGVVYSAMTSDVGAGFGIASYLITALAFVMAVIAAGQWLGLESPDSFSEADMQRGDELQFLGKVVWDDSSKKSEHDHAMKQSV